MRPDAVKELLGVGIVVLAVGVGIHHGFAAGLETLGFLCVACACFVGLGRWIRSMEVRDGN